MLGVHVYVYMCTKVKSEQAWAATLVEGFLVQLDANSSFAHSTLWQNNRHSTF